jgi:hypothetical protein
MEYTDEYSGWQMPCPACRRYITFPGLAPAMTRSSLRLARDVPRTAPKPRLTFLAMLGGLRYFINRKGVSVCLLACLFIAGVMLASPKWLHNTTPPISPKTTVDESIPVDPPEPPPVAASDSIPVDALPPPVAVTSPKPKLAAPAGQQGARGARGGGQGAGQGGRQGGRQGGARGRNGQRGKTPAAPTGARN